MLCRVGEARGDEVSGNVSSKDGVGVRAFRVDTEPVDGRQRTSICSGYPQAARPLFSGCLRKEATVKFNASPSDVEQVFHEEEPALRSVLERHGNGLYA